jgi:voltage-gated potassium channel Kch
MNKVLLFFLQLAALSVVLVWVGFMLTKYQVVNMPSMYPYLIIFYFIISSLAFFINIKGTQKESEIAVWYYMGSIMVKFLLAAASVVVLANFFPEQKRIIVFTSFILYPLFETLVIFDIYKRIRA